MKISKYQKVKLYLIWWTAIFPIGIMAVITPWFMYPLAELIERFRPKSNPLWWWLDDEIEDDSMNADWKEYKEHLPKWIRLYIWHCARNSMWNLKASIKPVRARVHCEWNEEEVVEVVRFHMVRNGKELEIDHLCLEMPVVRWIDRNGNASWQTLSGVTVNHEKTVWGDILYYYKAGDKLYFREGFVKEKRGLMIFKSFPFIGIRDYYHIVAKGCNEKRYIYTNKRQLVK